MPRGVSLLVTKIPIWPEIMKPRNAAVRRCVHTEKSFPNLIKLNRNHIVFTMHRLIWNQADVRLTSKQSENDFSVCSDRVYLSSDNHIPCYGFFFLYISECFYEWANRKKFLLTGTYGSPRTTFKQLQNLLKESEEIAIHFYVHFRTSPCLFRTSLYSF